VYEGAEISGFYDPMIAKVVVHEETRVEACEALARACAATDIFPVKTNAPFLWRALDDPDFRAARIDTGFIGAKGEALLPPAHPTEDMITQAAVAIAVQEYYGEPTMLSVSDDDLLSGPQLDPWRGAFGFRLNGDANRKVAVAVEGTVHITDLPEDWRNAHVIAEPVRGGVAVNDNGLSFFAAPARVDGNFSGLALNGAVLAPMPGRVTAAEVTVGEAVVKGQRLLTLEAMKMEHALTAPFDGIVAELNVGAGDQVQVDAVLARIEAAEQ
jgi:3-methylcrotonyl-CoA carboxylase alpha subunit